MLGNISDSQRERRLKAWWFPGASSYLELYCFTSKSEYYYKSESNCSPHLPAKGIFPVIIFPFTRFRHYSLNVAFIPVYCICRKLLQAQHEWSCRRDMSHAVSVSPLLLWLCHDPPLQKDRNLQQSLFPHASCGLST